MDQVDNFLWEVYESAPHNRILIKTIYEDFGDWVTSRYGIMTWNRCPRYGFYTKLRSNTQFLYKRYNNGICLVGLKYREKPPTGPSSSSQPISLTKSRGSTGRRGSSKSRGASKPRGLSKPLGHLSRAGDKQTNQLNQTSRSSQSTEIIRAKTKRIQT